MTVYLIVCRECQTCVSTLGTHGGHRAARTQLREHKALKGHEATLYMAEEIIGANTPTSEELVQPQAGFGWRGPAHR